MKMSIAMILCLFCMQLHAQTPLIHNVRLSLSEEADTLIVRYDITGEGTLMNVHLRVADSSGSVIESPSLSGDMGPQVGVGPDRVIYWDMVGDGVDIGGKEIFVTVVGSSLPPPVLVDQRHFPWLFVASGLSALAGTYSWYEANRLYDQYPVSDLTLSAEDYHRQVDRYDMIRNVTFGAALVFGVAGTVRHLRHKDKQRALTVSCFPILEGGVIGISYSF